MLHIARVLHIEMTPHLWHKLHALELDTLEDACETDTSAASGGE